ncbi:MAG: glycosyltransferase family 2 protein [Candidatus Aminicenantes bacterium]|jgi:glycosyltransferase involved in cell wall biosynthesis
MEISAVIISYNEEDRLEPTLKSVADIASEIIVVDSYSTDDTVKIAKKFTKKVFQRKWTNYSDQKNFANSKASFPWILSLDADERLSPELREEILRLEPKTPEPAAYSMPRRVFYLGKWIKHTVWYPDRKIRLFRKNKARWEGAYVHENLAVEGKVQNLKGPLLHNTYRSIHDHLERINIFSDLSAQKLYAQQKRGGLSRLFFLPILGFFKSYVLKAGFVDGFAGFVVSVLHSYSVFLRYAKLREIWKKGEKIEPFPG